MIGIVALAMSIFTVSLVHQFGATRPATIEPGRDHAAKIHGRIVYLSAGEYALALASHGLAIVAIGVFLGVLMKSRRAH
jgi:hypothetical protein